ncbi:hypothetical protein [Lewinella cohaerens]|uniref:hypothetical protein n=1 Tax=Lewinella cohaerens TaxID=70995 RepID=UPI0012EC3498|nr:hypothetical protein [Lewinella cohaerens]
MNKLMIGLVLTVLFFATACEQGELSPVILEDEKVDVFLKGEIREPGESTFSSFLISLDYISEANGYLFWQQGVTERPFSRDPFGTFFTTLIMSAYASDEGARDAYYGFQFWPEEATPNQPMTKALVEEFFALGNNFSFGEGAGKVDVSLRLPIGGPYEELQVSKSSFLNTPIGQLTIIEMEDYSYTEKKSVTEEIITGKLIRCTLEGQIGRYDRSVDSSDGMPWFETDEVVEIANAECVFFVEYD